MFCKIDQCLESIYPELGTRHIKTLYKSAGLNCDLNIRRKETKTMDKLFCNLFEIYFADDRI